ncbi:hypothetical protein DPMN_036814 [Dreissena polymorpha]|uniref:Secreted protein n=1 Tax=Dreissena polymorpha TaxID=45954 RepID=A0A9D4MC70_DREPO|nr:hypothetical protein DPMN_036814 [Dreissena polymorpha]
MTMLSHVALCGLPILWHTGAARAGYRHACRSVPTAFKPGTTRATISTCSAVRREGHATAEKSV